MITRTGTGKTSLDRDRIVADRLKKIGINLLIEIRRDRWDHGFYGNQTDKLSFHIQHFLLHVQLFVQVGTQLASVAEIRIIDGELTDEFGSLDRMASYFPVFPDWPPVSVVEPP